MSDFKDYYKLLNVEINASLKEIKTSYKKLAMQYHPDRNPELNNSELFSSITEAYNILKHSGKRAEYNYTYKEFYKFKKNNKEEYVDEEIKSHPEFKEYNSQNNTPPDEDIGINQKSDVNREIIYIFITIDFWEAAYGTKKDIIYQHKDSQITFTFDIPPITEKNDIIKLDLYNVNIDVHVTISDILEDHYYTRENLDLFTNIDIPFTTAILGDDLIFNHLGEDITVKIPSYTQSEDNILVKNQGISNGLFQGDLYLKAYINLPKKINKEQKKLIEQLHHSFQLNNIQRLIKKIKKYFKSS